MKEMQVDIDEIMKRNRTRHEHLSVREREDLLDWRKKTAEKTMALVKKYKHLDDTEIINSEEVNELLEEYRGYQAALDKYFG